MVLDFFHDSSAKFCFSVHLLVCYSIFLFLLCEWTAEMLGLFLFQSIAHCSWCAHLCPFFGPSGIKYKYFFPKTSTNTQRSKSNVRYDRNSKIIRAPVARTIFADIPNARVFTKLELTQSLLFSLFQYVSETRQSRPPFRLRVTLTTMNSVAESSAPKGQVQWWAC